jgi:hypothetical protein
MRAESIAHLTYYYFFLFLMFLFYFCCCCRFFYVRTFSIISPVCFSCPFPTYSFSLIYVGGAGVGVAVYIDV